MAEKETKKRKKRNDSGARPIINMHTHIFPTKQVSLVFFVLNLDIIQKI